MGFQRHFRCLHLLYDDIDRNCRLFNAVHYRDIRIAARPMTDGATLAYQWTVFVATRTTHIKARAERPVSFLAGVEGSTVTYHVRLRIG